MTDSIAKLKNDWLLRISCDERVNGLSVKLAILIALKYLHRERGIAWPSERKLAEELKCDIRSVRRASKPLEEFGYLLVTRKPNRVNVYRTQLPETSRTDESYHEDRRVLSVGPMSPISRTDESSDSFYKNPFIESSEGNPPPYPPRGPREKPPEGEYFETAPQPIIDSQNQPDRRTDQLPIIDSENQPDRRTVDLLDTFADFWRQFESIYLAHYQHAWSNKSVERELRILFKQGVDTASVINAAKCYVSATSDKKYLRNPASWLRDGYWQTQRILTKTIDQNGQVIHTADDDIQDFDEQIRQITRENKLW